MILIVIKEKDIPIKFNVNPEVSIFCPPGCPLPSRQYSDTEIMEIMMEAEITGLKFHSEEGRLAVINHFVNLKFRLISSMSSLDSKGRPTFEYYMELPTDFSQNPKA